MNHSWDLTSEYSAKYTLSALTKQSNRGRPDRIFPLLVDLEGQLVNQAIMGGYLSEKIII